MTFYFANINVGQAPNDGEGDPLRTAFSKINQNFNTLTPNIGNAEIRCLSLTSTYISSFNLVQAAMVGNTGTEFMGETLTVNTVVANTYVGGISSNVGTFANVTVTNTANIATLVTSGSNISGGQINGTAIGNLAPSSAIFTDLAVIPGANVELTSGNVKGVRYIVRNIVSHLGEDINGGANAYALVMNTTGTDGEYVVYNIASNTNVNVSITGAITTGVERYFMVRNQGVGTANLILAVPSNNTNKGSNVVPITGGTSAAIRFIAFGANTQSVFAEISNN